MTPKKALKTAISILGGQRQLAKQIGYSQAAISQWLKLHGRAPAEACPLIEVATQKAVTRHQLRPDLYSQPSQG